MSSGNMAKELESARFELSRALAECERYRVLLVETQQQLDIQRKWLAAANQLLEYSKSKIQALEQLLQKAKVEQEIR